MTLGCQNNAIGLVVIGVGVLAVVFSLFPSLLENSVIPGVATFPGEL